MRTWLGQGRLDSLIGAFLAPNCCGKGKGSFLTMFSSGIYGEGAWPPTSRVFYLEQWLALGLQKGLSDWWAQNLDRFRPLLEGGRPLLAGGSGSRLSGSAKRGMVQGETTEKQRYQNLRVVLLLVCGLSRHR